MVTALVLVLGVNVAFAAAGPTLARSLTPAAATRIIAFGAGLGTACAGFVLAVASFGFLAQIPPVGQAGQWSSASLAVHDPVPFSVGVASCLLVLALGWSAGRRAGGIGSKLWAAVCANRRLAAPGQQVVVLDDPRPDAYALPGFRGGRIVVTASMLAALDADERRVLLAHEASHLRHRHYLYGALTDLAASANPLLRGLPSLVRVGVERWADEDAAAMVADRCLVARAVARASLASGRSRGRDHGCPAGCAPSTAPEAALGMAGSTAAARTSALLRPVPRRRVALVAPAVALVLLSGVAAADAAHQTEGRFEAAHAAFVGQ